MKRVRAVRAALVGTVLFVCIGLAFPPAAASSGASIRGIARDSLGGVLQGVKVLVLGDGPAGETVAEVRTDENGRFVVPSVTPGPYRVAGLKDGYVAYLGRINTLVQSSLELVLRPSTGEENGDPTPDSLSWVLRVPDRSLLRDTTGPSVPVAESAATGGPGFLAAALDAFQEMHEAVRGEVRHVISLGDPAARGSEDGGVHGTETRMLLAGMLGERGNLRLRGRKDSFSNGDDSPFSVTSETSALGFDLSYATSLDTNLDVQAFYADGSRQILDTGPSAVGGAGQARRSWGYDARWSKQIDPFSRLAVKVGYMDSSLHPTGGPVPGAGDAAAPGAIPLSATNRFVGAEGSYESQAVQGHRLRFGVHARMLRVSEPLAGYSVRFRADDAWSVGGPVTVLYGLGVEQGLASEGPALIVPRIGGAWSSGGLRAQLTVSYHARAGAADAERVLPIGPSGLPPLGYDAEVDAPLPFGFRVKSSVTSTVRSDMMSETGMTDPFVATGSPYLAAGTSWVRQGAVSIERPSARTSASLAFDAGRAEGLLAPRPFSEIPLYLVRDRSVRYWSGRIGLRVAPSRTHIALQYQKSREHGQTLVPGFIEEFVEVRVAQEVLRLRAAGATCRLVLAARTVPGGASEPVDAQNRDEYRSLTSLNHRVSAGLAVAF